MIGARPFANGLQYWNDGISFFSQAVFHAGRDFIKLFSLDNVVGNQFFESSRQHGVRNIGHFLTEITISQSAFGG